MAGSIYLDPSGSPPNVIKIGDTCYTQVGPSSVPPTTDTYDSGSSDCGSCICDCTSNSDVSIAWTGEIFDYFGEGDSGMQSDSSSTADGNAFYNTNDVVEDEIVYNLNAIAGPTINDKQLWFQLQSRLACTDGVWSVFGFLVASGPDGEPTPLEWCAFPSQTVSLSCVDGYPVGSFTITFAYYTLFVVTAVITLSEP